MFARCSLLALTFEYQRARRLTRSRPPSAAAAASTACLSGARRAAYVSSARQSIHNPFLIPVSSNKAILEQVEAKFKSQARPKAQPRVSFGVDPYSLCLAFCLVP